MKGMKHLKVKNHIFPKSIKEISGFQGWLECSSFRLLCICIPSLHRITYRAACQEVLAKFVYITVIFYLEQQ